ncbi:MAG: excinuclease ABC subunit UvrB [Nanoarchaeota archaeon]
MAQFRLESPFEPQGDQPEAIRKLAAAFRSGTQRQTLLGVTGSGKTFTMAHVIRELGRPTLILSHNKTLAAQLYNEMQMLFPDNAVEYFVSYYDYYQPESYIPATDTYIEKETQINERIERLRLSAMHSLVTRKDVIIVSSVSCIYSAGDPADFRSMIVPIRKGEEMGRQTLLRHMVNLQYERNDVELKQGRFRARGDIVDIIPGYGENIIRVVFFGDEIEEITERDPITLEKLHAYDDYVLYPARQFVFEEGKIEHALVSIREELESVLPAMDMLEAHRLKQRTRYDVEMIKELGFCTGIENYSRHFDGRKPGQAPYSLIDYFDDDFLMIIDESHVTIPQVHGMYKGDRSRKKNLIENGFRLPSAFDNRPLKFEEFDAKLDKVLYVSATPAEYETTVSGQIVEQIIRPTGLLDPIIDVRPQEGQIENLLDEINSVVKKKQKVLVTTLTKRMAEHLTDYLAEKGVRTRYLHSDIDTLDRTEIIRQLRADEFDVLVGINLLREGLDIPEVALVAILDADKEGFLRNTRSLVQTIGRAARNAEGRVVMYADKMTDSMKAALEETSRRRERQMAFNEEHGITPKTIIKPVKKEGHEVRDVKHIPKSDLPGIVMRIEEEMRDAAAELDFERAIMLRDRLKKVQDQLDAKEGSGIVYD